jgi:hypothetical protein
MIKATTEAARNDVRGMFVKGMGKNDFPMIPLPFIPLTSFPALSGRLASLTVGHCRLPSVNDGAGYDALLRASSAIESPAIKPVMAAVKVASPKNNPCKRLTMNGVKPSQGQSNQLARRVKMVAQAAKFAGLGNEQSWQKVNLAGGLGDNIWQGVPDIVSYCQINSLIATFGHVWGKNIFCNAGAFRTACLPLPGYGQPGQNWSTRFSFGFDRRSRRVKIAGGESVLNSVVIIN